MRAFPMDRATSLTFPRCRASSCRALAFSALAVASFVGSERALLGQGDERFAAAAASTVVRVASPVMDSAGEGPPAPTLGRAEGGGASPDSKAKAKAAHAAAVARPAGSVATARAPPAVDFAIPRPSPSPAAREPRAPAMERGANGAPILE